MNKLCIIVGAMLMISGSAKAENDRDSLRVEQLNEVVVKGVKAAKDAPFAVSNINKQQLQDFSKTARELPFLFAQTPGVVAWSENGIGTGTTYMRIRGSADSRINVTIDGVQLNSPEDECVFWANMNSYSALLGSVQIQRGVGTSTNGDGAFGGSIALTTKSPALAPSLELTGSYGSYNTYNGGGQFSTGLLFNHLVLEGAWHHTGTDGFMHGTAGNSGSYYGGLSWIGDRIVVRYKNIGNYESTGQAWNGVDTGDLLDGNYGVSTGLHNYSDFWKAGLGRYNSLFEKLNDPSNPAAGTSRYQLNDGTLWSQTTDNFHQNHNILSLAAELPGNWKTSASLHYTYGYGYYEEFRHDNKLSKFGLANISLPDGTVVKRTDFIRKKGLEQHSYGAIWNINYTDKDWDIVGGLSLQNFDGWHFGRLTYTASDAVRDFYFKNGQHSYYDSDASKLDGNAFAKATFRIDPNWSVYADMQYRHVSYTTSGINDKFYSTTQIVGGQEVEVYSNQRLDIDKQYDFLNPKAGVSYSNGRHRAYASVGLSHREPERNNFTDNGSYPAPKAESMTDIELGYSYTSERWNIGLNAYYMKYDNQFVQTGELSDIGEALTTNIKDSYRAGLELTAGYSPADWLDIYGNAALSENRIKNFDEKVEDWDSGEMQTIHYDNSTLAFSPSAILNGFVSFHKYGIRATWHSNFVSKQYLDNTECDARSLPAYSQSNLSLSYSIKPKRAGLKEIQLGLNLNNVFDAHYAASGWVYSAIYASGGHTNDNRYRQIGYIPMAGRNIMTNLTIKF